ncbi:MAG: hypothetical protein GWP08_21665 [Nitrospiraceae bacterium]|nr:hypothetical protein [Nitrospiraceae bacterium]
MKMNDTSLTDGSSVEPTGEPAVCGPGCDCGSLSGGGKAKVVIGVVVLLAVAGVIAYKVFNGSRENADNAAAGEKEGFAIAAATQDAALEKASSGQERAEPDEAASSAKDDTRIGKYLESLSELNKVALNQDTVFIFVPAHNDESASGATRAAVLSAQKALNAKNVKVGLYTLKTTAPDFPAISSQVQVPAILVACKGRGMGAVSGEVTETKLLQAFMASFRAGGCGPSRCGPSSAECK